jgi:hypothetical protein
MFHLSFCSGENSKPRHTHIKPNRLELVWRAHSKLSSVPAHPNYLKLSPVQVTRKDGEKITLR